MKEQGIQAKIMIELSRLGGTPIRLNSGTAWQGDMVNNTLIHLRKVKLCPPGTPDILTILPEGKVLWVECKTATGKQRETQKRFQAALEKLGHAYIICRNEKELKNIYNFFNKSQQKY